MRRGATELIVLAAIVLIGAGWFVVKPLFSRDKKRAQESVQTTENLVQAVDAQASAAAASVTAIGTANSMAPESPSRDFIAREVPAALSKLPSPDPKELLEAEKRRVAVMEGRLEEANKLYQHESERASKLQQERDTAIAEKRAADQALVEAAAFKAGAEQQRNILIVGLAAAGALAVFLWFSRISPASIGKIAADIRGGEKPLIALDRHTSPWLHRQIRKHSKLNTEPSDD